MKFILLCGGIGERCKYSLPKPLNYINGKHMIEYTIKNIPSDEIHIVYNVFLNQYNFKEIVINLFKSKNIYFYEVDYLTRGAVETAFVGINSYLNIWSDDEQIVFIDNDNIHYLTSDFYESSNELLSFIGYGKDYIKTNYSFIKIENNNVVDIEEKIKISDEYCCGIYGFKNLKTFIFYAKKIMDENFKTKKEFYFSQLYKYMIKDNIKIFPIEIKNTIHIGSYDEIISNINLVKNNKTEKLRICFDLDNTLVTYPTIPNDYSSVKPICEMINLLHFFKKEGYEIIIHTARRMKTHNNNVGKVIKDIASITIDTLEKFNIEYDELIFGKPIADIYIDDRAINPYFNDISSFGFFGKKENYIHNKIKNNKYNAVKKYDNYILKTGPYSILKGELYFYNSVPEKLKEYFPELFEDKIIEDKIEIKISEIKGIPLYFLYKNKIINKNHIDSLFNILNEIHSYNYPITISDINIHNNYFKKLEDRFNTNDYNFENAKEIYDLIINDLKLHYSPKISGVIHGDFWFSNIILDYNDNYKLIDMKGQVDNILTLNGDIYYDYGKMYQSILGYDLVLNDCVLDEEYLNEIKTYFLKKCREINLNIDYLTAVTKSLIFGTIWFIENNKKKNIWKFINYL